MTDHLNSSFVPSLILDELPNHGRGLTTKYNGTCNNSGAPTGVCFHKRNSTKKPGYLRTEAQCDIVLQSLEAGEPFSGKPGTDSTPCKSFGNCALNKHYKTESNSLHLSADSNLKSTCGKCQESFINTSDCTVLPTCSVSSIKHREPQRKSIQEKMYEDTEVGQVINTTMKRQEGQIYNGHDDRILTSPSHNLTGAFKSRFSFIQQSLNSEMKSMAYFPITEQTQPKRISSKVANINGQLQGPRGDFCNTFSSSNLNSSSGHSNSELESVPPVCQNKDKVKDFKMNADTDLKFCCSVDSLAASSVYSSVTSGYGSSSSSLASESSWDTLIRKYEPLMLECIQRIQTTVKVKSSILKLQHLLQKAVEEEDVNKADTLRKILEDQEKNDSVFSLPSRHPFLCSFLDKLQYELQVAILQSTDRNSGDATTDCLTNAQKQLDLINKERIRDTRKYVLVSKRHALQKEIQLIKKKLQILEAKDHQLKMEVEGHNRVTNIENGEMACLISCIPLEDLQEVCKALKETLESSFQVTKSLEEPESLKRLYEQELSLCLLKKEATAQVCTNQQLCDHLQRKVNAIENKIPPHLTDNTSGNNFCASRELTEEMKSLIFQKTKLEKLLNELLLKNSENMQHLDDLKKSYNRLKKDLQEEEDAFVNKMKEHAIRYMDVLKEKLQGCGNQLLERVWEADLEACQLLIREIHLKGADSNVSDARESQTDEAEAARDVCLDPESKTEHFYPKAKEWAAARKSYQHKFSELEERLNPEFLELLKKCDSVNLHMKHLEDHLQNVCRSADDRQIHILSSLVVYFRKQLMK
ncbi:disrupted in schizophrenia 1 protein [Discoglossus pictus]